MKLFLSAKAQLILPAIFMRNAAMCLMMLVLSRESAFAQSQAQQKPDQHRANVDPLGMTCASILAMPSSDYIAKITAIDDSIVDGQLRGIRSYGACYDARTETLAAWLARRGKGPDKAARSDFAAFESALKDFTAKALADLAPQPVSQKEAYATLYEKQFRYEFYQEYEAKLTKTAKPAPPAARTSPQAGKAAKPATSTAAPAAPGSTTSTKSTAATPATAEERTRSDADPVTQAKNRFGKLLDALADDQMHELHRAFGEVIGPHTMSETTRLAVYRYAIFLLEPKSVTPFASPPF
jgi:hypothetical protein